MAFVCGRGGTMGSPSSSKHSKSSNSKTKGDHHRKRVNPVKLAKHVGKKSTASIGKFIPERNILPKYKLHVAIQENNFDAFLKELRKKPGNIDQPDNQGRTPLQIACLEGNFDMVKTLVQMKCDVDIRERQGWTALHYACASANNNSLHIINHLIRKGNAYAHVENNAGATPLSYLVLNNPGQHNAFFLEIVMLMISKGVDINSQDKAGETAIHQVAIRGLEETLAILVNIKGVNLNIPDVNGETCLHFAARGGHLRIAQILLTMGADYYVVGKYGTCLKVAEDEGHFNLIEFLREWECSHTQNTKKSVINPTHISSITFNTKLIEAAEMVGIEKSVAIACLYQMQLRGEPTDDLQILMAEASKSKSQSRECTVCLSECVDSLFLPCRHSATCMDCAELVRDSSGSCPICREKITDVLQIYLS